MLYLMARSTALDGDWNFDNDLARFGDPWNQPRTQTGRKGIVHPIGPALVWTPLIWIAEGGAVVANLFGADIPLHGYTLWHQRIVFLSSVLFGCGAVLLARKVARASIGGMWAPTYGAVAVLLGTSLTYYSTYMPSYSHAMDAFACAALLGYWSLTLGRADLKRWLVLGGLLGLAGLVRIQELAMGSVVALEAIVRIIEARTNGRVELRRVATRWLAGGGLVLLIALLVLIPQFVEWKIVFGSFTGLPQGPRFTRPFAPMIGEVLFAPRNGWFSSTPLAYFGVLGLFVMPRRLWLLSGGLILATALQVYLDSTVFDWWSGASFGQRRLCNVSLPLVIGLAAICARGSQLVRRLRRVPTILWHIVCSLALGVFVRWNLNHVTALAGGKPAPEALKPTCCGNIGEPFRGIAAWIYDRIGNPFEFPANAYFALKHDVSMKTWDRVVGNYPLQPNLAELNDDDRFYRVHGAWNIGSDGIGPYLLGEWSPVETYEGRGFRYTTEDEVTVLVPNLMPDGQRLTLWLAAAGCQEPKIMWNGTLVANPVLQQAWLSVSFDLPDIALHTNELTIACPVRPFVRSGQWPDPQHDSGVAVGELQFEFLH